MTTSSITARGKRRMASIMLDTCRITKPGTGERVFDDDTGQYADPPRVTVYEGPCRIQVKADINSNLVETTAGDREWTYTTSTLQLPSSPATDGIRSDHVAELLTSKHEPDLVGRFFNVQGVVARKSDSTHHRYRIREVTG